MTAEPGQTIVLVPRVPIGAQVTTAVVPIPNRSGGQTDGRLVETWRYLHARANDSSVLHSGL